MSEPQPPLREALRREVAAVGLLHPYGTRVVPAVHLGRPSGPRVWLSLPLRPGHSRLTHDDPYAEVPTLRRDAAARLVEAARSTGVAQHAWLVREGDVGLHDGDLAWEVALRAAHAEVGATLGTFHVLTRNGWREVATGEEQRWTRLRVRGRVTAAAIERTAQALREAAQSQVCTGSLLCIRSV